MGGFSKTEDWNEVLVCLIKDRGKYVVNMMSINSSKSTECTLVLKKLLSLPRNKWT